MLLNTWAIARFGMRTTFVAAMAVFIMGRLLGAGSQGLETLVLGRVLQGAGVGLIQPMAVLLIYQAFPDSARGTALGVYSLGVIFSPALGPAIGGVWLICLIGG
jgi:DHA2 family multidrug resistance protein